MDVAQCDSKQALLLSVWLIIDHITYYLYVSGADPELGGGGFY